MDGQSNESRGTEGAPYRVVATCQDCGQEYDATGVRKLETLIGKMPRLCPSCRGKLVRLRDQQEADAKERSLAYHRKVWLESCGLPPKYWACNFDGDPCCNAQGESFNPTGNEERVQHLARYAAEFPMQAPPRGYPSLLITSPNNGVGKTHLAAAIIRSLIGRFDQVGREHSPFQFWTAGAIRRRLADAQRFSSKETVEDVYALFASMWLLVLDDLGKERSVGADAATTYEVYYTVINERYNRGLPLLITSNLGLSPWSKGGMGLEDIIGLAGVSRLREMTNATEITMQGADHR